MKSTWRRDKGKQEEKEREGGWKFGENGDDVGGGYNNPPLNAGLLKIKKIK
jgi:hypothetical protein